jgi:hypothetical protein
MRKTITVTLSALMVFCIFLILPTTLVKASTIVIDGYTFDKDLGKIISYSGSDTNLVIPSVIDSVPVTSIGDNAFFNNDTVTSITIPDSVTSMGNLVFAFCDNLTTVTMGTGITSTSTLTFTISISTVG